MSAAANSAPRASVTPRSRHRLTCSAPPTSSPRRNSPSAPLPDRTHLPRRSPLFPTNGKLYSALRRQNPLPNSLWQNWIAITTKKINEMRAISSQLYENNGGMKKKTRHVRQHNSLTGQLLSLKEE